MLHVDDDAKMHGKAKVKITPLEGIAVLLARNRQHLVEQGFRLI